MSITVQELEKKRINLNLRRKIHKTLFFIIPVIGISLMVYAENIGFGDKSDSVFYTAMVIIFFNFFISAAVWAYTLFTFNKLFKEDVLEELIHSLLPNINYTSDNKISKNTFIESHLFPESSEGGLEGSDYFTGNLGNKEFELSVLSFRSATTDSRHHKLNERRKSGSSTQIFSGLFMASTLEYIVQEPLYIMPKSNSSIKALADLSNKLMYGHLFDVQEIPLSDFGIEGNFAILCNNEKQAKHILISTVMDEVIRLYHKYPAKVFISFIDNKVYCAIGNQGSLFYVSITQSVLDTESKKGLFKDLNDCLYILKSLSST